MKKLSKRKKCAGFTLVELLVASFILAIVIIGMLVSYLRCLELAELSKNISRATSASRSRVEAIKNTDFDQSIATYNTVTFTSPDLNGIGVSYVTAVNPDLLKVTVTFCWRQKNRLVVGEDKNLNGIIDAGEDTNANGMLDSTVQLVNYIYRI